MAKVRLGLKDMTIPAKIQFANTVVGKMTANPNFTTPNPPLATVTADATALETAYNDVQQAKLNLSDMTNVQNSEDADLDQTLTLLANYVNNTSGGDASIIMSAGMSIAAPPTPQPVPAQVIVTTVSDNSSGKLDIKWEKIPQAKTYTIQQNSVDVNDPEKWTQVAIVTKTKHLATGLTSGTKYWFRVQAIGTAGEGPWSDPYVKYAP